MVLTCKQLFQATENPRINDLSVDLLREYYETYLNPYIFQYEIQEEGQPSKIIELRFDTENFCHLLGIEKIMKYSVDREKIKQFKGQLGWDNVVNGTITIELLREKKTKKQFNNRKQKFVFFYLIPQLVDSPKGVLYNADDVNGNTDIDCEILFYDSHQNAYVHLGIKYDADLGYYIPKTFFVEKITLNNGGNNDGKKYIENQTKINVTKVGKVTI